MLVDEVPPRPARHTTVGAVETLAIRLAADAGIAWHSLSEHPGYMRYMWREKARDMLAAAGTAAPVEPETEDRPTVPRFLT